MVFPAREMSIIIAQVGALVHRIGTSRSTRRPADLELLLCRKERCGRLRGRAPLSSPGRALAGLVSSGSRSRIAVGEPAGERCHQRASRRPRRHHQPRGHRRHPINWTEVW